MLLWVMGYLVNGTLDFAGRRLAWNQLQNMLHKMHPIKINTMYVILY